MKTIIALIVLASAAPLAQSQPTITSVYPAWYTTKYGGGMWWTTSDMSSTKVEWGLVTGGPYPNITYDEAYTGSECGRTLPTVGCNPVYVHAWFIEGAPAASVIYYKVCSGDNVGETCSSEQSLTTAAASAVQPPILPTPVDAPVYPTGTIHTVTNCDDPVSGLIATDTAAAWGDVIEIDNTVTQCVNPPYVFTLHSTPNPSGLNIVIRAKNWLANSPINPTLIPVSYPSTTSSIGQVSSSNVSNMVTFLHTSPNVYMVGSADPTVNTNCFAGDYLWRQNQGGTWQMFRCVNILVGSISALTTSGHMLATVNAHGLTGGPYMGWVIGATGTGTLTSNAGTSVGTTINGAWYLNIVDANTLGFNNFIGNFAATFSGTSTGGSVYVNRYQLEPVTEGVLSSKPTSCTWGSWWHQISTDGSQDQYHRTYYCNSDSKYYMYQMDINAPSSGFPVIDLFTNKVSHHIFQGLNFQPLALKYDPLRLQYKLQGANGNNGGGILFWTYISQNQLDDHIYFDQVYAAQPIISSTGSLYRMHAFEYPWDGSHISITRSVMTGFQSFHTWRASDGGDLDDGSSIITSVEHGPGPVNLQGNISDCAGICHYVSDDFATISSIKNIVYLGNSVTTPDIYWNASTAWATQWASIPVINQPQWSQRHRIEFKLAQNIYIGYNTLTGGWVWNNNGAALCLCVRGGSGGFQVSNITGNNVTSAGFSGPIQFDWTWPNLTAGDYVFFPGTSTNCGLTQIYQVASATSTSAVLTTSTGCSGATGSMTRLNNLTYVSDAMVTNNYIQHTPTGIYLLGHDSYGGKLTSNNAGGLVSKPAQRISFYNNLIFDVNQGRVGTGIASANPANAPAGSAYVPIYASEDLNFQHLTVYPRTTVGGTVSFINSDVANVKAGPNTGAIFKFNIGQDIQGGNVPFIENDGTGQYGITAFNVLFNAGGTPNWSYDTHVLLGSSTGYPQSSNCLRSTVPSPHNCTLNFGGSATALWPNSATGDFTLANGTYRTTDACYGTIGDCTDDGLDVGVIMSALPGASTPAITVTPGMVFRRILGRKITGRQ